MLFREQAFYFFRPLHQAVAATVEIFFHPDVVGFLLVFQAVAIKMKNGSGRAVVLIDQCECGAGNRPRYSKFLADGPDQGGFSCTHFSVKQHNALISGKFQKLTGAPGQFIEGIAFELEGLHGVKIRFLGQPDSLQRFGGIPGALRPPSQIKMSLRPAAPKTGKGSYSLKRFGGIPALCARPSKSTCRFVRLPQKRERGRTRSSHLGGSRVLCARPPKSKCRFVRLPQKRERGSRRRSLGLFAGKNSEWNDHFLQGNAPMLECVQIILNKLVVIVLIYKILIFLGKNVT